MLWKVHIINYINIYLINKEYAKVVYICNLKSGRIFKSWNLPIKLPEFFLNLLYIIHIINYFFIYLIYEKNKLKRVRILKNWNLPMKLNLNFQNFLQSSSIIPSFYLLYKLQGIACQFSFLSYREKWFWRIGWKIVWTF